MFFTALIGTSQSPKVMARPGLLPEEPPALALTIPGVPRHQVSQEALCARCYALTLAPSDHVLGTGARGPRSLTPGEPHGALQEFGGSVVQ